MFLQELIIQERIPVTMFFGITQSIIILCLIITNSFFVKEFIPNKGWFYLVCILNGVSFISITISHTVPAVTGDPELYKMFSLVGAVAVLSTLWFTFMGATKDIFKLKHDLGYSLLGAVNIFILIGFIFTFFITISGSVFPNMVVAPDQISNIDAVANKLAFYALAIMDSPFDPVNPFIRNILMLESIFAHLFVVVIIGRLLSK